MERRQHFGGDPASAVRRLDTDGRNAARAHGKAADEQGEVQQERVAHDSTVPLRIERDAQPRKTAERFAAEVPRARIVTSRVREREGVDLHESLQVALVRFSDAYGHTPSFAANWAGLTRF